MRKDPHIANIFSAEEEDCLQLEQMAAYQQGKLAGQEKNHVERHLLNCELCAMTFEALADHSPESITAGAAEVSDRVWDRVQQQAVRTRRGAIYWIASAASIVLLVTVGYFTMRGPTATEMAHSLDVAMQDTPPLPVPTPDSDASIAMLEAPAEVARNESGIKTAVPTTIAEEDMLKRDGLEQVKQPSPVAKPSVATAKDMVKPSGAMDKQYAAKDAIKGGKDAIKGPENYYRDMPSTAPTPTSGKGDMKSTPSSGKSVTKESVKPKPANAPVKNIDLDNYSEYGGITQKENRGVTTSDDFGYEVYKDEGESDALDDEIVVNDVKTLANIERLENQQMNTITSGRKKESDKNAKEAKSKAALPMSRSATKGSVAEKEDAAEQSYDDGIISYKEGKYSDAAQALRKATELTPSNLDAHIYAADAFLRITQPQAALFHIERVLAVPGNSHFEDAEWYKALAHLQLKEGPKAKKQLEKVIARGGKYKAQAEAALAALNN
jgi:hypothetical protein